MIISKSFLLKISNVKGVLFLNLLILKYIKLEIKVGHGFAQMWQVRLKTKLAEFFFTFAFSYVTRTSVDYSLKSGFKGGSTVHDSISR